MTRSRICSIPDCDKPLKSRGWCPKHYKRWERHGDPLAGKTFEGEPARFLREVAIPFTGDKCLTWPFSRCGRDGGYGSIVWGGSHRLVHRLVCEMVHGPADDLKLNSTHSCGKGHEGCVNPRHLRWATPTQNQIDRVDHDTHARGERAYNAKLSEEDIGHIRFLRGRVPQRQIARFFGVTQTAVSRVQLRKVWAWLD